MANAEEQSKEGELKRGDLSDIARRLSLSVNHVAEVAKKRRAGSAKLNRALALRRAARARQAQIALDATAVELPPPSAVATA
jgi:hypothetical protein